MCLTTNIYSLFPNHYPLSAAYFFLKTMETGTP